MGNAAKRSPNKQPSRKRYTNYVHVRVKIRFHFKPPIGWIFQGRYYDRDRRLYEFPRDGQGNVVFDSKYWRGMFGNCLSRYFSDTVLSRNPYAMREIRINDVAANVPLGLLSDFGAVYEQIPLNFEVETIFTFPLDLISIAEFTSILKTCGEYVGWAPCHAEEGYGQFTPVEIRETSR